MVTCSIYQEGRKTILKIQSTSTIAPSAFDFITHEENIKKLYGELRFRLDSKGKPKLKEVLRSEETILKKLFPIEYQDVQFFGYITNSRLLISRNKLVFVEIAPLQVKNISLNKERNKKGGPYFYGGGILTTLFTILLLPFLFIPYVRVIMLGICVPFILLGVILIIAGVKSSYDLALLIQTTTDSFKLSAQKKYLLEIENVLRSTDDHWRSRL